MPAFTSSVTCSMLPSERSSLASVSLRLATPLPTSPSFSPTTFLIDAITSRTSLEMTSMLLTMFSIDCDSLPVSAFTSPETAATFTRI